MFSRSLRASRSAFLTHCLRQPVTLRRNFITPTFTRRDIIKDLYLRELSIYRPPVVKLTDAEGQVKSWKSPTPPSLPLEAVGDLAAELAAYESQEVETESTTAEGGNQVNTEEDWFEPDEEEEH